MIGSSVPGPEPASIVQVLPLRAVPDLQGEDRMLRFEVPLGLHLLAAGLGWGWQVGSLNPTLQHMVSTSRDCVPSHIGGECMLDPTVRGHQYDLWILFRYHAMVMNTPPL